MEIGSTSDFYFKEHEIAYGQTWVIERIDKGCICMLYGTDKALRGAVNGISKHQTGEAEYMLLFGPKEERVAVQGRLPITLGHSVDVTVSCEPGSFLVVHIPN